MKRLTDTARVESNISLHSLGIPRRHFPLSFSLRLRERSSRKRPDELAIEREREREWRVEFSLQMRNKLQKEHTALPDSPSSRLHQQGDDFLNTATPCHHSLCLQGEGNLTYKFVSGGS